MTEPPELVVLDAEPPGADVIERLEEVLAEARKGEVSSVAIATVYRDGTSSATWSTAPSVIRLLGAVSRLAYKLNRQLDDD